MTTPMLTAEVTRPRPEIRHRDWLIEQSIHCFEATHPDYRGPGDERFVEADTLEELAEAIELWIEENA